MAEDPVTLIHARAMLAEENVEIIGGNFRDPEQMLAEPALTALVDLGQPCGFLAVRDARLHRQRPPGPRRAAERLRPAPRRAATWRSCTCSKSAAARPTRAVDVILVQDDIQLTPRHVPEIEKIIEGFELWDGEPLMPVTDWRPVPGDQGPGPEMSARAGAVGAVIVKR